MGRRSPIADDTEILRRVCHAFASTTDLEQAIAGSVAWVREAAGSRGSSVSLLLPDPAGRLRLTATAGRMVPEGRLRSSRRRLAYASKHPVRVELRKPPGRLLWIVPLVSRGEVVGLVEVVGRRSVLEARAQLLEAVAAQAAAVLRNARERQEGERALRGLRATVGLASQLLVSGSPERALRIAVDLCHEHLSIPVVGWLSGGPQAGRIVVRGLGSASRRTVRLALEALEPLPPAEAARRAATALAPSLGTSAYLARAGDAVLAAGGRLGESGRVLVDTVGGMLDDVLRSIDVVTEARARNDGLDLGIALTAHEIRGPLVGARAAIDHVLSGQDDERSSRLLRGTRDELEHLASLVDPLLRWALGSGHPHRRRTDLVKVVSDAVASFELDGAAERIAVLAPDGLELRADPKQLRTALANLLRNALDYSPDGQRVVVEVGRGDGVAWVSVRDHGPGVRAEERDLIFDPLARGLAGATSRNGAGLGLFVARRVAEAHDGTLRLLPSRRGAVFCLELPTEGRVRSAS